MPNVVREDIDNLNIALTVVIERNDYEPKLNEELKKYQKRAAVKGFRKGKTPMSFLRKLYGEALLADIMNETIQDTLYDYLDAHKLNFLGQPIPSDDQKEQLIDIKETKDVYEFRFDLGLVPEFELLGADASNELEEYEVEVPEKTIDEELEMARRKQGERLTVEEGPVLENDLIYLDARELDGDTAKEDGWEGEIILLVSQIADEAVKAKLLAASFGDTISFNVYQLEKHQTEAYVKKYLLQMSEEEAESTEVGADFEGTILRANRVIDAELNQDFFDKQFGEGLVTSEEEAREKIKQQVKSFYQRQAEGLLFRDLQNDLLEKNEEHIPLPEDFLKRWLQLSNENNTPEVIERDFENFKRSIRWSLVQNKLTKQFGIKVDEQDIRRGFEDRIRSYLGNTPMMLDSSFISATVDRMMEDEGQVESLAEELHTDRLFENLKKVVTVKPKTISIEELTTILQEARAQAQPFQDEYTGEEE